MRKLRESHLHQTCRYLVHQLHLTRCVILIKHSVLKLLYAKVDVRQPRECIRRFTPDSWIPRIPHGCYLAIPGFLSLIFGISIDGVIYPVPKDPECTVESKAYRLVCDARVSKRLINHSCDVDAVLVRDRRETANYMSEARLLVDTYKVHPLVDKLIIFDHTSRARREVGQKG